MKIAFWRVILIMFYVDINKYYVDKIIICCDIPLCFNFYARYQLLPFKSKIFMINASNLKMTNTEGRYINKIELILSNLH